MRMFRFITGYLLGFAIFVVLIPLGMYQLSTIDEVPFSTAIFSHELIRLILSVPLFIVGSLFAVWSNIFLLWKGKGGPTDFAGVAVSPRTKWLVVDGPYRYTRNPMVFGMNTLYVSLAFYFNSWGALLAWLLFYAFIVQFFVFKEEQRLLKDFGDEYEKYRATTAKTIPFLKR